MTNVEYTFKFAYTSIVVHYNFNNSMTMWEFINHICHKVFIDFDIRNDLTIEIVEAGINTNQHHDAEMANAIQPSNISFRNFYINRSPENLSFYIRVKTCNNNVIRDVTNMQIVNNEN